MISCLCTTVVVRLALVSVDSAVDSESQDSQDSRESRDSRDSRVSTEGAYERGRMRGAAFCLRI